MSVSVYPNISVTKIEPFIGETPLFPLSRNKFDNVKIDAKLEWHQLGGSVKSRPAYRIIKDAIARGKLNDQKQLVDATSGNTGIAYATILNRLGLGLTLFVPDNASEERKKIFKALGVDIRYTSGYESTEGAREAAKELVRQYPDKYFYADQYDNPSNWKAHYDSTANEIWRQTEGKITHFVAGLGTTGTFTGTCRRLKELNPEIELIALQPETALHGLEGWKHLETADTPAIYDHRLADRTEIISTEESYETMKTASRNEGLLLSPSSAANLAGAKKIAANLDRGHVVTVFPDDYSKYISETNIF